MSSTDYSKTQYVLDSFAVLIFIGIYCWDVSRFTGVVLSGHQLLWLIPLIYILAALCADLISGLVHFLGDHPIGNNPWLDKWFYASFSNHHVDPAEMTRHSLVQTSGLNALAACIALIPSYFYHPNLQSLLDFSVYLFILFFSFLVFMTNQIHKWAHTPHPPI